ncbi:hypothetical protein COB11_06140 [Candidatus Aerophobetes bacterium]|uniref:IS3 family transposase n=1 Tax=Aerophobetes bacterium TaxID=2030807 RepID=A0A2A4YDP1_UNCAE|nr:MAG: hypothetical protein COB11_07365 [Candidatus Aerophobetes bacterium]PCI92975.1 MAG: hypothetical protein COB11_06140 [Candidatus Aerophobetes bacterium]
MSEIKVIMPKRWRAQRKKEIVLRLFKGELIDEISREIGVGSYRLEEWRQQALTSLDSGLKDRENDPLKDELLRAKQRIGDLAMENELLKRKAL